MNPKTVAGLISGIFVIVMIASTEAFSEIIKGFSSAMGDYGFIIGILIVLAIIAGLLGAGGRRR